MLNDSVQIQPTSSSLNIYYYGLKILLTTAAHDVIKVVALSEFDCPLKDDSSSLIFQSPQIIYCPH